MKVDRSVGLAPLIHTYIILSLGHKWRLVASLARGPLYPPGKDPRYPWVGCKVSIDVLQKRNFVLIYFCQELITKLGRDSSVGIATVWVAIAQSV